MSSRFAPPLLACLLVLALAACSDDDPAAPGPGPDPATPAPDFALEDVNSTSATFGTMVSPRDHLARISAWYFGRAT